MNKEITSLRYQCCCLCNHPSHASEQSPVLAEIHHNAFYANVRRATQALARGRCRTVVTAAAKRQRPSPRVFEVTVGKAEPGYRK